jgi:hypothetical protein
MGFLADHLKLLACQDTKRIVFAVITFSVGSGVGGTRFYG